MAADPGAESDAQADAQADAGAEQGTDEQGTDEGTDEEATSKRKRPFWRDLVVMVAAAVVITILLKTFVAQVFSIPSGSMENTLLEGDRILVSKVVYDFRPIDRGDIVVFGGAGSWDPPESQPGNPLERAWDWTKSLVGIEGSETDYVKRVIGLPGDHVACCNSAGKVTVNGVPLSESSYLYPGAAPSELRFNITVPAGQLWVMGDNRGDSADSRYHTGDPGGGSIPESAVVGRAFLVIWPLSRFTDLPIPNTFEQAGLSAAATAAAAPPAAVAGGSAAFAATALVWRRRRR